MHSKLYWLAGVTLLVGIAVTALVITPWHNLEAFALPKLVSLTLSVGLAGIFLLFSEFGLRRAWDSFCNVVVISILLCFVNLIVNHKFMSERIFGVQGRNVGALTLFCLFLLSLLAFLATDMVSHAKALAAIKTASFFVAIYFLAQDQGLDLANWEDSYALPSSTLGNPNFVSSFVAIGIIATLPTIVSKATQTRLKTLIVFTTFLEILVLMRLNAFQGFLIVLFGLVLLIIIHLAQGLHTKKTRIIKLLALSLVLPFSLMQLISKNENFLLGYDTETIRARIEYWSAGIRMGIDSPLFGKGFDSYGEYYLRFRSSSSDVIELNLGSNSAHNYFIDMLVFGGLPLLLCMLILVYIVLSRNFERLSQARERKVKNSSKVSSEHGLLLAWFGFLVHSCLSPINLPLAYLGFLLTGLLAKTDFRDSHDKDFRATDSKFRIRSKRLIKYGLKSQLLFKVLIFTFLFSLPFLSLYPLNADAKFRDAIEEGNGTQILAVALSSPKSFERMDYASQIFIANGLTGFALQLARDMVTANPENVRGWKLLEELGTSESEIALARVRIQQLDPVGSRMRLNEQSK